MLAASLAAPAQMITTLDPYVTLWTTVANFYDK
jgi:hypothetical protein